VCVWRGEVATAAATAFFFVGAVDHEHMLAIEEGAESKCVCMYVYVCVRE
jgi:hypothetical protein